MSGIAVMQEQHGWMLGQRLGAAAAEPDEESRLNAQAEQQLHMEAGIEQIGAAVDRAVRKVGG